MLRVLYNINRFIELKTRKEVIKMKKKESFFKPLKDGWGLQPLGPSQTGRGDIHDTFKVGSRGNISGGHTTVRLPGGKKKHLSWQ